MSSLKTKISELYVAVEYPDGIAAVDCVDSLSCEVLAVYRGKETPVVVCRNTLPKEAIRRYMGTYGVRPLTYRVDFADKRKTFYDEGVIVGGEFVSSEKIGLSLDAVGDDKFIDSDGE